MDRLFSLNGKNVRLIPLELEHCDRLYSVADEDRSTFHLTSVPRSLTEMTAYVERACTARSEGKAIPFLIIDSRTGSIAGSTRFANLEYWEWPRGSSQQRPS